MNIVVTGASSGIGFEAVLELLTNSENKVIALARSDEKLRKLSTMAKKRNPDCILHPKKFDIIHDDYDTKLLPFLRKYLGQVDVLINNAGSLVNKPFEELSQLDFVDMLQYNFLGHVKMIQHILPLVNENAHILNIGSMGGFHGSTKFPGLVAYSSSKAALHSLTECLAAELNDYKKIKVNCLALGSAQTEMLEEAFPEYQSPVSAFEMGKFVADFAQTGHKYFNGKIIPVAVTTP